MLTEREGGGGNHNASYRVNMILFVQFKPTLQVICRIYQERFVLTSCFCVNLFNRSREISSPKNREWYFNNYRSCLLDETENTLEDICTLISRWRNKRRNVVFTLFIKGRGESRLNISSRCLIFVVITV
jgi:hypothetical protein